MTSLRTGRHRGETHPAETPDAETPDAETPDAETPDAETPDAETPAAETPAVQTADAARPVAPDADSAPESTQHAHPSHCAPATARRMIKLTSLVTAARFLRQHMRMALGILAVLMIPAAGTQAVLVVAHREATLQNARLSLVRVTEAVAPVRLAAQRDEAGTPVPPSEYALSAKLRGKLAGYSADLVQVWPSDTARAISRETARFNGIIIDEMHLVAKGSFAQSRRFDATVLQPAENHLNGVLDAAAKNLAKQVHAAERNLRASLLLLVGGAAALVVLFMIGLVRAAPRRSPATAGAPPEEPAVAEVDRPRRRTHHARPPQRRPDVRQPVRTAGHRLPDEAAHKRSLRSRRA